MKHLFVSAKNSKLFKMIRSNKLVSSILNAKLKIKKEHVKRTAIALVLTAVIVTPISVYAGGNGWISGTNSIYGETSAVETETNDSKENTESAGFIEKSLCKPINKFLSWIDSHILTNSFFSVSTDTVVFGRLASTCPKTSNGHRVSLLQFNLGYGNPYGIIGSYLYRSLRVVMFSVFFLYFVFKIAPALFAGGPQGRAEFKKFAKNLVLFYALMYIMPYLVHYFIYFRDIVMKTVAGDLLTASGADAKSYSMTSLTNSIRDMINDGGGGIAQTALYASTLLVGLNFFQDYLGTALVEGVLFGLSPLVCFNGVRDEQALRRWSGVFFSNLLIPLVDSLLVLFPSYFYAISSQALGITDKGFATQSLTGSFFCIICILMNFAVPASRTAILRAFNSFFGLGMPQSGISGLMNLGKMGADAARGAIGGGPKGGGPNGGDDKPDKKEDTQTAKDEAEKADEYRQNNEEVAAGQDDDINKALTGDSSEEDDIDSIENDAYKDPVDEAINDEDGNELSVGNDDDNNASQENGEQEEDQTEVETPHLDEDIDNSSEDNGDGEDKTSSEEEPLTVPEDNENVPGNEEGEGEDGNGNTEGNGSVETPSPAPADVETDNVVNDSGENNTLDPNKDNSTTSPESSSGSETPQTATRSEDSTDGSAHTSSTTDRPKSVSEEPKVENSSLSSDTNNPPISNMDKEVYSNMNSGDQSRYSNLAARDMLNQRIAQGEQANANLKATVATLKQQDPRGNSERINDLNAKIAHNDAKLNDYKDAVSRCDQREKMYANNAKMAGMNTGRTFSDAQSFRNQSIANARETKDVNFKNFDNEKYEGMLTPEQREKFAIERVNKNSVIAKNHLSLEKTKGDYKNVFHDEAGKVVFEKNRIGTAIGHNIGEAVSTGGANLGKAVGNVDWKQTGKNVASGAGKVAGTVVRTAGAGLAVAATSTAGPEFAMMVGGKSFAAIGRHQEAMVERFENKHSKKTGSTVVRGNNPVSPFSKEDLNYSNWTNVKRVSHPAFESATYRDNANKMPSPSQAENRRKSPGTGPKGGANSGTSSDSGKKPSASGADERFKKPL